MHMFEEGAVLRTRAWLAGTVVAGAVLVLWQLAMHEVATYRDPVPQVIGVATALALGVGAAAWVTRT